MMIRPFILKCVLLVLCLCPNLVLAESIDLIKDGKITARATALFDEDSQPYKQRLFRLTLIINEALSALSGDVDFTEERFYALPNRIRVLVVPKFKEDAYMIAVKDAGDGMELRIAGRTIEHTERAVHVFLSKYLDDDQIKKLEAFADRVLEKKESAKTSSRRPSFKKVRNLVLDQEEAEVRKVIKE